MAKIFPSALVLLLATAATTRAEPQFRADGAIVSDNLVVDMGDTGTITATNARGVNWTMSMNLPAGGSLVHPKDLGDSGLEVIKSKRLALYSGTCPPPGDSETPVTYSLELTPEKKAKVTLTFPAKHPFSGATLDIAIPKASLAGETIRIDEKEIPLPAESSGGKPPVLFSGPAASAVYFSNDESRKLALSFLEAGDIALRDGGGNAPGVVLSLAPKNGRIAFEMPLDEPEDARSSGEKYAGVDFWAADKLKMPQFKLSKNLVQNSGFEEGLKYWEWATLGALTAMRLGEPYLIEEGGYSGKKCLKILGEKDQFPAAITTFAIPVVPGDKYTFSFHAKADRDGVVLESQNFSAVWPKFPGCKSFRLTTEWKRYSVSFEAPNGLLIAGFGLRNPPYDCAVWVDAVQVEKGPLTDYEEKPFGVGIVTARRDNFFEPGETIAAAIALRGSGSGTVTVKVTDFFDSIVKEETVPFTIGETGQDRIPLPWMEGLPAGIYVVELSLQAGNGYALRDFDRIAVMPSAAGLPGKHSIFFCAGSPGFSRLPNWKRSLERYRHLGIGSMYTHNIETPELIKAIQAAGIFYFCSIFDKTGEVSGEWNLKTDFHRTPEELAVIEETAYQRAKASPELSVWKTLNEPGWVYQDNMEEMKKVVECLAAARKGILRANPKALILSPDPANMYPTGGIQYLDTFLKAEGKTVCDIIAIHPYRLVPEHPDLDADTAAFIKMLDAHGYHGDIWFDEALMHSNYTIPAYDFDAHRGAGSPRAGALSYHIGWGEHISFAYIMRTWLVGLKYADRVKLFMDWGLGVEPGSYLDINMVPFAKSFAVNVLSRLLGNADFHSDLDLGRDIRGYLFQDGDKRPVAAIWTCNEILDHEGRPGPKMDLSTVPAGVEFIDCMGKTIPRPPENEIALSSFPLFLRGTPDSLASLRDGLGKARVGSGEVNTVEVSARVVTPTQIEIGVRNILSRPVGGNMKVLDGDAELFNKPISIPGKETWKFPVALRPSANGLNTTALKTEFLADGTENPLATDLSQEIITVPRIATPPVIDGDVSDWPAGAAVKLPARFKEFAPDAGERTKYPDGRPWKGDADLSATMYSAWDASFLYLAFLVKDDTFTASDTATTPCKGDSVQIYFDCWTDARSKLTKGFDNNDMAFDLWPSPEGLVLTRTVAPEAQLAFLNRGVVSNAKTAFKRTPDGYLCEVAIPARDIVPIRLAPDSTFGFAALINENDADWRKRGLTLTPSGTEPVMRPDLYPVMILGK